MSFFPKKLVVVPVDFSDASFQAAETAAGFVEEPSQLHVIHVTQPLHVAEPGVVWGTVTDSSRLQMSGDALRKELASRNLQDATVHCELGLPGRTIAELASRLDADLIVMPSHGRSGVQRLFLGSVTEKVLRMAECPVLVLRADKTK